MVAGTQYNTGLPLKGKTFHVFIYLIEMLIVHCSGCEDSIPGLFYKMITRFLPLRAPYFLYQGISRGAVSKGLTRIFS